MLRFRSPLLCSVALGLGCASRAETPATPIAATSAAGETPATQEPPQSNGDRRAALRAMLDERLRENPDNGAVLYVLARGAAGTGEVDEALDLLERLAAIETWDYPLDLDDFAAIRDSLRFTAVAKTIASRAPVVTPSDVAMELDRVDLLPEGLAWDPKRGELLVGSAYHRQIFAADREGRLREVIQGKAGGVLGVLGMDVDAARDQIWVAAVGAPFIADLAPGEAGVAGIWGFDLESGAVIEEHLATRSGAMLNDLVVLADGTIVVTDSGNGSVLVRRPGAEALEEIIAPDTLLGPNGIAQSGTAGVVFVADLDGLHRLDVGSGELLALPAPDGVPTLGGIDGLDRQGKTLVGVQNAFTRGRVWAITVADDGRSLTAAQIVDDDHPRLEGPTTGVFVGPDRFWYISNAGMQFGPTGPKPIAADKRHTILEVSLAPGAG